MRVGFFGYGLIVVSLISCGSSSVAPTQPASAPATTALPECFTMVSALPPQPELATIPLPPMARIKGRYEKDTGPITFIGGVVGEPDAIAAFFESELPAAGFSIDYVDTQTGQSHGIFSKDGQRFEWNLVMQTHCPGIAALQLLINPEE
ncbi:hypothetical protein ACP8Y2_16030 [Herpetosiphon llansteffanensis]